MNENKTTQAGARTQERQVWRGGQAYPMAPDDKTQAERLLAENQEAGARTQVEQDYLDGKWVPSYYGNKFTVARRIGDPGDESEQDTSFKVATLVEAQAEAGLRNMRDLIADAAQAGERSAPARQAQHTPGPWQIYKAEDSDFIDIVIQPGCGEIARLSTSDSKSEANARLIAAGPETKAQRDELLAAGKHVLKYDGHKIGSIGEGLLRAAIARIERRAP